MVCVLGFDFSVFFRLIYDGSGFFFLDKVWVLIFLFFGLIPHGYGLVLVSLFFG